MLLPIPKTCPEVDIHEFDAGHDLQLLLDASAPLDGVIEDHLRVVVRHPLVREQKLHKAAERLAHSYLVARVEIAVEPIEIVQMMGVVALAHALAELAQAIGDEPVTLREQVAAHLGHLPAGKVAVDAVEEGRILVELGWERVEQVRRFEHVLHAVVDVSLEHHRRIAVEAFPATGVRAAGHVPFENLYGIHVLEMHTSDLVECHDVPVSNQARALER